ncbi:MAG: SiaB family protein kinase [Thermodesulfobacteriota bacterium]
MIDNLYGLYRGLKQDGIIFCFSGPTSQSVVEGIGEALRHKMELEDTSMTVSHRVFAIFVEQMQNVVNYSAEKAQGAADEEGDLRNGMVVVGKKGERFYVISGNYIAREDAARIAAILDRLRGMGREELKAFYKEQRRREPEAGSKGAGLGLIETARKASEISYELADVDDEHSFLSINAVI